MLFTIDNVFYSHRIHVVNQDTIVNLVTFYSKITTVISSNNVVSKLFPLSRCVKSLIDVAIKPKSSFPNLSSKR